MQITSGSRHFYWKQEKPEIELIFIESELYYKSRTSAAGENYAQIPSKTSADHKELYQSKALHGETFSQFFVHALSSFLVIFHSSVMHR